MNALLRLTSTVAAARSSRPSLTVAPEVQGSLPVPQKVPWEVTLVCGATDGRIPYGDVGSNAQFICTYERHLTSAPRCASRRTIEQDLLLPLVKPHHSKSMEHR